jgi:hypothetical protein
MDKQVVPLMEVEPGTAQGNPEINPTGQVFSPLMTRPQKVAIVCLGVSSQAYVQESMTNNGFKKPWDEVWTLNRGIRGYQHDKVFCMDDLRWIEKRSPDYARFLQESKEPIIVSTAYPEYPSAIEYPYQQVLDVIGDDVFNVNTVSYMVAYAIAIGVKLIGIYGADFFYPNGNTAEAGGQAVAYLLGRCAEFGIQFRIPNNSTLMYAHKVQQMPGKGVGRPPYGYHRKEEMAKEAAREQKRMELSKC